MDRLFTGPFCALFAFLVCSNIERFSGIRIGGSEDLFLDLFWFFRLFITALVVTFRHWLSLSKCNGPLENNNRYSCCGFSIRTQNWIRNGFQGRNQFQLACLGGVYCFSSTLWLAADLYSSSHGAYQFSARLLANSFKP